MGRKHLPTLSFVHRMGIDQNVEKGADGMTQQKLWSVSRPARTAECDGGRADPRLCGGVACCWRPK